MLLGLLEAVGVGALAAQLTTRSIVARNIPICPQKEWRFIDISGGALQLTMVLSVPKEAIAQTPCLSGSQLAQMAIAPSHHLP
jgi:hypothetical protein